MSYTHLGITVLFGGMIGISTLLPLSFGTELTTQANVTNLHVDMEDGTEPVAMMPCFGPPDETLRVGGQQILHYRRLPSSERLQACLRKTATDEMYVLVNGRGVVNEFLLTTSPGQRTTQAVQHPE